MDANLDKAVNIAMEADTIRKEFLRAFSLSDAANEGVGLERVLAFGTIFQTHSVEAAKEALSGPKAKAAGIIPKSAEYNRLMAGKAFLAVYLAGAWEAVSGDVVTVTNDDGKTTTGGNFELRYMLARQIRDNVSDEQRKERQIENQLSFAKALAKKLGMPEDDASLRALAEEGIAEKEAMQEAAAEKPAIYAERTIKRLWKAKGAEWSIAFAKACDVECSRLAAQGTKGAIRVPEPAAIALDADRTDASAIAPTVILQDEADKVLSEGAVDKLLMHQEARRAAA